MSEKNKWAVVTTYSRTSTAEPNISRFPNMDDLQRIIQSDPFIGDIESVTVLKNPGEAVAVAVEVRKSRLSVGSSVTLWKCEMQLDGKSVFGWAITGDQDSYPYVGEVISDFSGISLDIHYGLTDGFWFSAGVGWGECLCFDEDAARKIFAAYASKGAAMKPKLTAKSIKNHYAVFNSLVGARPDDL